MASKPTKPKRATRSTVCIRILPEHRTWLDQYVADHDMSRGRVVDMLILQFRALT